jgi:hypothetical protein
VSASFYREYPMTYYHFLSGINFFNVEIKKQT